jgi:predicted  nucleic acid-binding Zn-ribbon protein
MCTCCNNARPDPKSYGFFAEGCLHCAARRIQYLQRTLRLGESATKDRCRAALAQAMALGLPELEIRRMAKLAAWQVAPPEAIQQPASSNVQRKHGR